ncbi:helix-turn-helix transcriptional regulator [Gammaproteobacteria bacterium AS21]
MVDFGQRLKFERNRLGLNQTELSERVGVTKKTQSLYERGDRSPSSDYLIAAADIGIDVLFLVTGNHTVYTNNDLELSSEEVALVNNYRASTEKNKSHIEAVGASFAQQINNEILKERG